jgi:hypothetical protein
VFLAVHVTAVLRLPFSARRTDSQVCSVVNLNKVGKFCSDLLLHDRINLRAKLDRLSYRHQAPAEVKY